MAALINSDDSPSRQSGEDGIPIVLLLGQAVQEHNRRAGSLAVVMVGKRGIGAVGQGHSHRANAIGTNTAARCWLLCCRCNSGSFMRTCWGLG